MESGFAWGAFAGALVGSVVAFAVIAFLVRGWLDRRLASLGSAPPHRTEEPAETGAGLADIAPELVTLARAATDSAIRSEELNEWHRPSMTELGDDDVSEIVRGRLRRASFSAVAARASLSAAIRRHRAALPDSLQAELRAFCERLEAGENGASSERKRHLASDLDALEARIREALGSDAFRGDPPQSTTTTLSATGMAPGA